MIHIRPAQPSDVPTMLRFIRELAEYEREPDAVLATEADLLRDGWGLGADGVTPLVGESRPRFAALIGELDGEPVGFALYFWSYSTWRGHHGIRLEDLYVTPAKRKHGVGKTLLARLAKIAVDEGCPRLEWDVLDWNAPAIAVYERIGAWVQTEWRIMRLADEALHAMARMDRSS
ncbi:L-amino acid N-acyltransferase YncA [Bryocella elongata]|uniref:L-amino acid N-acyltransferase YncA n=1 Tax=Bryocella elongata TaxID=863522 RepID=A0A1H6AKH9_9BACT|nr:GNAT family N-acetyltransferase [Bryocella elongata]SEG48922.1 L-amino acid N-acyltransferase YncA [Bryocella elongata]